MAAYLGSKINADLNILVTPLHSLDELRKIYYPWIPKFLMRYNLNTSKYLKLNKNKVVIIQASNDEVIPENQAKKLHKENPQSLYKIIKGANHNNIHEFEEFNNFLESLVK